MSFLGSVAGIAALASQAYSTVSNASNAYYGAKAAKSNALYEAGMANINAQMAEMGVWDVYRQRDSEVASLTQQAGIFKSHQKASLAGNGVDLGSGSASEILASTDIMKQIDTNTLVSNAINNAFGYKVEANNYRSQAVMKMLESKNISPSRARNESLINGVTQFAGSWYGLQKAGVLGGSSSKLSSNNWEDFKKQQSSVFGKKSW